MSRVKEFKTAAKVLQVKNHTFQRFDKDCYDKGGWYAVFKNNNNRHKKFSIHFDGDTLFPQTEYCGEPKWYPYIPGIKVEGSFEDAFKKCLELAEEYL